nr:MAG TPA: hypothetical protein [Caudoviricetes sp.]
MKRQQSNHLLSDRGFTTRGRFFYRQRGGRKSLVKQKTLRL